MLFLLNDQINIWVFFLILLSLFVVINPNFCHDFGSLFQVLQFEEVAHLDERAFPFPFYEESA